MKTPQNTIKTETKKRNRSWPYTAIVYFHGIGRQRRNEEISRLIDSLDHYSYDIDSEIIRKQKFRTEEMRDNDGDDVEFISTLRVKKNNYREGSIRGRVHFYEAYWSPALAGGLSSINVLIWVFFRLFSVSISLLHPWRTTPRLKLSLLWRLRDKHKHLSLQQFQKLEKIYTDFGNLGARRQFPSGSFRQFIKYVRTRDADSRAASDQNGLWNLAKFLSIELEHIKELTLIFKIKYTLFTLFRFIKNKITPTKEENLLSLTKKWRTLYLKTQFTIFIIFSTILMILINFIYISYKIIFLLLNYNENQIEKIINDFNFSSDQNIKILVFGFIITVGLYIIIKSHKFLSMELSDVVFWTTSDEKDEQFKQRQKILHHTEKILQHVTADPNCRRVVVIGHSLGAAIALETLLRLGKKRHTRSEKNMPLGLQRLSIITDLITIGSPIDLISWLFEARPSTYHRYNRIMEDRRGSTDDEPFCDPTPIKWVNIVDPADPISSGAYTIRGSFNKKPNILEWQTASRHVSSPLEAHSGYFQSKDTLNILFERCIRGTSASKKHWNSVPIFSQILRQYGSLFCWVLFGSNLWAFTAYIATVQFYPSVTPFIIFYVATTTLFTAVLMLLGRLADRMWPLRV
tara:strand:+ start:1017 stop:2909 length:1893 start_codon:yes stop_codon:yes gene_type:complete